MSQMKFTTTILQNPVPFCQSQTLGNKWSHIHISSTIICLLDSPSIILGYSWQDVCVVNVLVVRYFYWESTPGCVIYNTKCHCFDFHLYMSSVDTDTNHPILHQNQSDTKTNFNPSPLELGLGLVLFLINLLTPLMSKLDITPFIAVDYLDTGQPQSSLAVEGSVGGSQVDLHNGALFYCSAQPNAECIITCTLVFRTIHSPSYAINESCFSAGGRGEELQKIGVYSTHNHPFYKIHFPCHAIPSYRCVFNDTLYTQEVKVEPGNSFLTTCQWLMYICELPG